MDLEINVLKDQTGILKAKALLYDIYIKESAWIIPDDHPAEIRIKEVRGLKILTDKFEDNETWVGVFAGNKLIACHRNIAPVDGKFELEAYIEIPDFIKRDKKAREVNRMVIHPAYRNTKTLAKLVEAQFYESICRGGIDFSAVPFPAPGMFYVNLLGYQVHGEGSPFKFDPSEPDASRIVYIPDNTFYKLRVANTLGRMNRENKLPPQGLFSFSPEKKIKVSL